MKLYEIVSALSVRLELSEPELIQHARATWNFNHGSIDGSLADQILVQIKRLLPLFDEDLKREAYNEIADAEGLSRIDDDETEFDGWISEALLPPVMDELMSKDCPSCHPIH